MFEEKQRNPSTRMNYSESVAAMLKKMDAAHASEHILNEAVTGYGLVQNAETHPTVTDIVTTLEQQITVSKTFSREIARLLARNTHLKLIIKPGAMSLGAIFLEGDENRRVLVAIVQDDRTIQWADDWSEKGYKESTLFVLQKIFNQANPEEFLSSQVQSTDFEKEERKEIEASYEFLVISSEAWAIFTKRLEELVIEMIINSGQTLETAVLFFTHYHPVSFLQDENYDQLLTFSSTDLETFINNSGIHYLQVRTVKESDQLETLSVTIDRNTLKKYLEPTKILSTLVQSLESKNSMFSGERLIEFIKEYLDKLPENTVPGLEYGRVFEASTLFSIWIMMDKEKNWKQTLNLAVGGEDTIKEHLQQTENVYRYSLTSLVLYHLMKLRNLPTSEQRKLDLSILKFFEEIDIFSAVAALACSWQTMMGEKEKLSSSQLPSLETLCEVPFLTDENTAREVLRTCTQFLIQQEEKSFLYYRDLIYYCHSFGVDIEKLKAI